MDYCGTDNVSLSHKKISQVYRLRSGVRQPHELCLRARLRDDLLLRLFCGNHPCVAEHDITPGVRLATALMHPVCGVDVGMHCHLVADTENDAPMLRRA